MTISPIFDQLSTRRPISRPVDRAATPVYASISEPKAAPLAAPVAAPRASDDLTAAERESVAAIGTAVAQLILGMLDDDTKAKRRWPFHAVK